MTAPTLLLVAHLVAMSVFVGVANPSLLFDLVVRAGSLYVVLPLLISFVTGGFLGTNLVKPCIEESPGGAAGSRARIIRGVIAGGITASATALVWWWIYGILEHQGWLNPPSSGASQGSSDIIAADACAELGTVMFRCVFAIYVCAEIAAGIVFARIGSVKLKDDAHSENPPAT